MSKGMWTKCLTPEGRPFYYNAVQNQSLWEPPAEVVIHEAANLKIPEVAFKNINVESNDQFLSAVLALSGTSMSMITAIETPVNTTVSNSIPQTTPLDPETLKNDAM